MNIFTARIHSQVFSICFQFNEIGRGQFWVDNIRFHKKLLFEEEDTVYTQGFLYLDDFDHSDVNLLGRKCGTYKKLPSVVHKTRELRSRTLVKKGVP